MIVVPVMYERHMALTVRVAVYDIRGRFVLIDELQAAASAVIGRPARAPGALYSPWRLSYRASGSWTRRRRGAWCCWHTAVRTGVGHRRSC